ncbi:MAG: hypothetical protein KIT84_05350 [Labilithrix sp.]|nr:hypothetical protein [Labilithrix sp.]MCW5810413.1 hypothetical protein [Labilithrix sp.]
MGGGPGGAIAAYVLARAGRRVLLVDDDALVEGRVIGESLPAIAGHLLGELELRGLLGVHAPAFGNLSSWGSDDLEATDFIHDPHGHGWHLDRARFNRDLREAAVAAGATLRATRLRDATRGPDGWALRFTDAAATETAACIIDATGRRATIARREGATRTRDDDLLALYAWTSRPALPSSRPPESRAAVSLDAPSSPGPSESRAAAMPPDPSSPPESREVHGAPPPGPRGDTRTLVEATARGWWYTAPLPDGVHVVVLHVGEVDARAMRDEPARWRDALAATRFVSARLAGATFAGPPQVTEACGARLDTFLGRGWVATGDAALSFDPVAAQGLFNALYTGMKAGIAVDAALRGDPKELAAYARRLEEIRAAYVERHRYVYMLESRFSGEPFWAARRREMA